MESQASSLTRLRDEATALFVGHHDVVGVAIGRADRLTVLLATPNPPCERLIRDWASERSVAIDVVITGLLRSAAQSPA